MPRNQRIHFRHAIYHIMLRGNNKQKIFHQKMDYQDFLRLIESATKKYNASVLLYCLMTNHIHMVIEVGNIPISKIMQSISTVYAKIHNLRHNKIGHVFQGRFLSKLVHDDQYLLELCRYIHMNPLKAKMTSSLDDYKWSSHHDYLIRQPISFISTTTVNRIITKMGMTYLQFMDKTNNITPTYCHFNPDDELTIKDSVLKPDSNSPLLALNNVPLNKIIQIICSHLNISEKNAVDLYTREATFARSMIAYYGHYHAKYSLKDIARYFGMQSDSLSKTLHRHLTDVNENPKLREIIEVLDFKLSVTDTDSLEL